MGYYRVKLTVDNKPKSIMLHRIIAMAFIENPKNYPCVNHKDGNKKNNNISNLEWCTQKYNILHARATGLVNMDNLKRAMSENGKKTFKNICGWNSRKVINKSNGIIYPSVSAAAKDHGINRRYLHDVLSGKGKNKTTLELLKIWLIVDLNLPSTDDERRWGGVMVDEEGCLVLNVMLAYG